MVGKAMSRQAMLRSRPNKPMETLLRWIHKGKYSTSNLWIVKDYGGLSPQVVNYPDHHPQP